MGTRKHVLLALAIFSASAVAQVSNPAEQLQPGQQSQSLSNGARQSGGQWQEQTSGASGMQSGASAGARFDTGMLPPPAPMTELAAQKQGDVTFLCGGVGESEESYMKSEARNYDMMLTFAARNGAYLADVKVEIADSRGNALLQANCGGPLMLVDLPKGGSYRIRAESGGHTVTRTARVQQGASQGRQIVMTWPLSVAGIEQDDPSSSVGESGGAEGSSGRR